MVDRPYLPCSDKISSYLFGQCFVWIATYTGLALLVERVALVVYLAPVGALRLTLDCHSLHGTYSLSVSAKYPSASHLNVSLISLRPVCSWTPAGRLYLASVVCVDKVNGLVSEWGRERAPDWAHLDQTQMDHHGGHSGQCGTGHGAHDDWPTATLLTDQKCPVQSVCILYIRARGACLYWYYWSSSICLGVHSFIILCPIGQWISWAMVKTKFIANVLTRTFSMG